MGLENRKGFSLELDELGSVLDHIMTIDVGGRGVIHPLYQAARRHFVRPLTSLAASRLVESVQPGSVVLICTGFPVRIWVSPAIGETDGPPGAAALAWALVNGFNALPLLLTPEPMVGQLKSSLNASGLLVTDYETARKAIEGPRGSAIAVVEPLSCLREEARVTTKRLLEDLNPTAVLSIEHPGENEKGVCHSATGQDITSAVAKAELLFATARQRGVLTMSFADMANEIGTGLIRRTSLEHVPFAGRCQCPCQAGIASVSEVDHLVMATTANWGAYATIAALSLILTKPEIRFSRSQDARAIAAVQQAGAMEGLSGSLDPEAGVDGILTELSGHIIDLMNHAAGNWEHVTDRWSSQGRR